MLTLQERFDQVYDWSDCLCEAFDKELITGPQIESGMKYLSRAEGLLKAEAAGIKWREEDGQ